MQYRKLVKLDCNNILRENKINYRNTNTIIMDDKIHLFKKNVYNLRVFSNN